MRYGLRLEEILERVRMGKTTKDDAIYLEVYLSGMWSIVGKLRNPVKGESDGSDTPVSIEAPRVCRDGSCSSQLSERWR
jgi:hypothetical protein